MESEWVPVVDPWKAYVSGTVDMCLIDDLLITAGAGKSTLLYVMSQHSMGVLKITDISNQFHRYPGHSGRARSWIGHDGVLLFRLS